MLNVDGWFGFNDILSDSLQCTERTHGRKYISGDLSKHSFFLLDFPKYSDIKTSSCVAFCLVISFFQSKLLCLCSLHWKKSEILLRNILNSPWLRLLRRCLLSLHYWTHCSTTRGAAHQVRVCESTSVVVDKLYVNQGQGLLWDKHCHLLIIFQWIRFAF